MSESDQGADGSQSGAADVPARHVLLVEDEELVAMAMAEELQAGGWTVVGPATTLEEAQALGYI